MTTGTSTHQQAEALYHQGLELLAVGNPEGAAFQFKEALSIDLGFLDVWHGLIRALQDLGEYDQATTAALQLIALDPDDALAHTSLSILYQHQGRVPEAEAEALKAKLLGWKTQLRELRELREEE